MCFSSRSRSKFLSGHYSIHILYKQYKQSLKSAVVQWQWSKIFKRFLLGKYLGSDSCSRQSRQKFSPVSPGKYNNTLIKALVASPCLSPVEYLSRNVMSPTFDGLIRQQLIHFQLEDIYVFNASLFSSSQCYYDIKVCLKQVRVCGATSGCFAHSLFISYFLSKIFKMDIEFSET